MTFDTKIKTIREKLLGCERPLFLFDDDPDGLASFLLLYKFVRAGKGMPLKGAVLDDRLVDKVNQYAPDLVVILDTAVVAQEFFDGVQAPCVWIDHHEPTKRNKVVYLNPRTVAPDNNLATSHLAYLITKEHPWLAAVGVFSDWQVPQQDIVDNCNKEFPDFIPKKYDDPAHVLFETHIGVLAKAFSFNLKGRSSQVLASMKILTRIDDPFDLLEKKHSQARLIMKKYEQHKQEYDRLLASVSVSDDDPVLLFKYADANNSFTTDLSNELLFRYPKKLIIIARCSNGSCKCSLRGKSFPLRDLLAQVLEQTGGTGGGHEHACGCVVDQEQFDVFVELFRAKALKYL